MLLAFVAYQKYSEYQTLQSIDSYEACITAKGSIIQESYPATCVTSLGTRYTQPTLPIIDSNMVNWITYNNDTYNFSFRYPSTLSKIDSKHELEYSEKEFREDWGSEFPYDYHKLLFSLSLEGDTVFDRTPIKFKSWRLYGAITRKNSIKTLNDYYNNLVNETDMNFDVTKITIANQPVIRFRHCEMSCGEIAVFQFEDKFLEIELYTTSPDYVGNPTAIFNQILSTFKFHDAVPTL